MPWTESSSDHFEARHEDSDELGTLAVLELLETTRASLARTFPRIPDEVTVVMHAGPLALSLAAPVMPLAWIACRRGSRRYLAGWCSARTLHLRLVPGSNDIKLTAFSADGAVSSNPAHTTVYAHYSVNTQPQLYAMLVGIQDYTNPKFDVK